MSSMAVAEIPCSLEPGDTQMNSQQVYDDYQNNLKSFQDAPPTRIGLGSQHTKPSIRGTQDGNTHTYATGDLGYVDFVLQEDKDDGDGQENMGVRGSNESNVFGMGESQEAAMAQSIPAPLVDQIHVAQDVGNSQPPETPQLAGHKRNRSGQILPVVPRTPAPDLAAAFNMDPRLKMGLSQVFNNTQAVSSPAPHFDSDDVIERPSPGLPVNVESPVAPTSSPELPHPYPTSRATTEPRDNYVPLQQSQERRRQQQAQEAAQNSDDVDDDEDDDFLEDSEDRKAAVRRYREERFRPSFSRPFDKYYSKSRTSVEQARSFGYRTSVGAVTPAITRERREVICISDDTPRPATGAASDSGSADDVYDEYIQDVISSQFHEDNLTPTRIQMPVAASNLDSARRVNLQTVENRISHNSPILPPHTTEQHHRPTTIDTRPGSGQAVNQRVEVIKGSADVPVLSIADSQPPRPASQPSTLPSHPVLASSIDSRLFVSESQGISLPSVVLADLSVTPLLPNLISSSNPPRRPPLSSVQNHDHSSQSSPSPLSSVPKTPPAPREPSASIQVPDIQLSSNHESMAGIDQVRELDSRPAEPHVVMAEIDETPIPAIMRIMKKALQSTTDQPIVTDAVLPVKRRLNYSIPDSSPAVPSSSHQDRVDLVTGHVVSSANVSPNCLPSAPVVTNKTSVQSETELAALFSTAQTHQSGPLVSPQKRTSFKSQSLPKSTGQSPQIPRFGTRTEPSSAIQQSQASGAVDFAFDILRDHDEDFQALVNERPVKHVDRRKNQDLLSVSSVLEAIVSTTVLDLAQRPADVDNPTPSPARHTRSQNRSDTKRSLPSVSAKPGSLRRVTRKPIRLTREHSTDDLPPGELDAVVSPQPMRGSGSRRRAKSTGHKAENVGASAAAAMVAASVEQTEATANVQSDALVMAPVVLIPGRSSVIDKAQDISFPHRVLARFKGTSLAFWPATCLGLADTRSTVYKIRFDDGNIDMVDSALVRRFDLHVDDLIRIDLPGMRTKTYHVRGFRNQNDFNGLREEEFPKCDIFGNTVVVVQARGRDSLPAGGEAQQIAEIDVPIASIYLTNSMWINLKDRVYDVGAVESHPGPDRSTPVLRLFTPTTPSSRTRRHTLNSTATAIPKAASALDKSGGVFSQMAFAITYAGSEEQEKSMVTRMISLNGGRILSDGFEELFDLPPSAPLSPSRGSRVQTASSAAQLALNSSAKNLVFAALIADGHSRRAKYMQALALNIPCLSGRWIADCSAQEKLLPWDKYLLPAGESTFLGGAIRSRTFAVSPQYDLCLANGNLANIVDGRSKLLHGKNIVLVLGKGKIEERRKAYVFLTTALGAARVERVRDVEAAKSLLVHDRSWEWVCVDDNKVEQTSAELFGLEDHARKKRKRNSGADSVTGMNVGQQGVRVVGDEYIVQSLILGSLLEA